MSPADTEGAVCVGAVVDPTTHEVMAWISTPGHTAHLVPLPAETARRWARMLERSADAADFLHESEPSR
ncbi:hypothetical protein [Streptomonospora arabica]|uniref:IclR-ED domain-containing protein n=1 Tax=Streptomonospora arabica TaxID=412417 RepID=A0ABV9SJG0_9ACTN